MRKGVSAIIATIMLLMIAVALVALLWSFSATIFSSISSGASRQTDVAITRAGTEMSIVNAKNSSLADIDVTIRNSGTQDIDLDTLVAFVDDSAAYDNAAGKLAPGSASSFTVISPFSMSKCSHVLRVSASYSPEAYYTINC